MPRCIVVDESARGDVLDITGRIAADNFDAALRVFDAIEEAFKFLCENPLAGPSCELAEPDLVDVRFWPLKRYRQYLVLYRPITDGVEVMRVLNGARDMYRVLRRQ